MSILVRYEPSGLTKDVYDDASSKIEQSDDLGWMPEGLDYHVCFGDDGDLRVSEVWDSREQWEAFSEKLIPVLQDAGVQFGGEPQVIEIHKVEKR